MITFTLMTTTGGNTGLYYYGARYYDPKISVWLSVDAMAANAHNMPLTPYHFSANNPVMIIDPDGNDWFVNGKTGELMFVKGVSDLAKSDKELSDLASWSNIGADDMFGEDVSWYGDCILDYESTIFTAEAAEEFMGNQGYTKGYESNVTERAIVTNGSESKVNDITITQKSTTVNDQIIAYFKPEQKGVKRNISQINMGRYYDVKSWKATTYDIYSLNPIEGGSNTTNSALANIIGSMFYSSEGGVNDAVLKFMMKWIGKGVKEQQKKSN